MVVAQNPLRCYYLATVYHVKPSHDSNKRRRRRRKHLHLLHAHFQFPSGSKINYTQSTSPLLTSTSNAFQVPYPHSPHSFIPYTIATATTITSNILISFLSISFQPRAIGTRTHQHSGLVICADDEIEQDHNMRCLPVDFCSTRDLGPCLTIKEGYAKLKEALQHEKLLTSSCASTLTGAVIQYRVLVPPSAKALDWFCSQQTAFPIYPHFYFSSSNQPNRFLRFSSFGHALCIHGSYPNHKGYRLLSRSLCLFPSHMPHMHVHTLLVF
jgi:hypothetical protein